MMMGELMGVMVGHDAFTQALTNPLLAAHIFNEETFTQTGTGDLPSTTTLQQIFERKPRTRPGRGREFRTARVASHACWRFRRTR